MIDTLYPIFQSWSLKGSVYVISDTHFDDPDRECMGYEIPEEEQIEILKKYCHKNDTLIHLGDVGNPKYMEELKCYKVLVMGNHDQSVKKMRLYFNEVYSGPIWIAEKLILSHEPVWFNYVFNDKFAFNIHGHNHSDIEQLFYKRDYDLNLCPNIYGYKPLNLKNFINSGKLKNIKSIHRITIDDATERKINRGNNSI